MVAAQEGEATMQEIIDISVEISEKTVLWPSSKAYSFRRACSFDRDKVNVSEVELNLHTGTHIDTPLHFIEDGKSTSEVDLEKFCGKARVICLDLTRNLEKEDLADKKVNAGEIILFNIAKNNDCLSRPVFCEDYVALNHSAAQYLIDKKVKAVGINYLTIGDGGVHTLLLNHGMAIIETLDLAGIGDGEYEFYGFPLKIRNGEGSPVRAVLLRDRA